MAAEKPVLDIEIKWVGGEAHAPKDVRDALDHLIEVLNKHGLKKHVGVQGTCFGQCGHLEIG